LEWTTAYSACLLLYDSLRNALHHQPRRFDMCKFTHLFPMYYRTQPHTTRFIPHTTPIIPHTILSPLHRRSHLHNFSTYRSQTQYTHRSILGYQCSGSRRIAIRTAGPSDQDNSARSALAARCICQGCYAFYQGNGRYACAGCGLVYLEMAAREYAGW
jgi:hypothetical protein